MKKTIFLLVWGYCTVVHAQKTDFYGNAQAVCSEVTTSTYDTEIKSYIQQLLAKAGRTKDEYIVSGCKTTPNCQAAFLYGKPYILFNPEFWESLKNFNFAVKDLPKADINWVGMTILAHELGHIVNRHWEDKTKSSKQLELEADNYAGYLMYQMGATLSQTQQAMYHPSVKVSESNENYSTHPFREQRLQAIEMGYTSAKATSEINPNVALKVGEAEYLEGLKYFYGQNNVTMNYKKSFELLNTAAAKGYTKAYTMLGHFYYNGYEVSPDQTEAVVWYQKAAKSGDIDGQYFLGLMYNNGHGVNHDSQKAAIWFLKAAEQGNKNAQYYMGLKCENGWGITKSASQALNWYLKAAEQGHSKSQYEMGIIYRNGYGDTKKNYKEAIKWFSESAKQGDSDGQYGMGLSFEEGKGVKKNLFEALRWYRKAAENNSDAAQFKIGYMYENGLGVEKNIREAIKWYGKAVDQGNMNAGIRLNELLP